MNTNTLTEVRNIFSYVMESHQKNDGANGKILYYFRHSNKTLWSDGEDDFEVVFRNPIPPKAIERLIPLYRTNKQFRAFRDSRKRNGE